MGFLILAVLSVITAAATVWLVHIRRDQEDDPDGTFWYTFAGLCVLAPVTLIPAWKNNMGSLGLLAMAAAAAIAMHALLRRRRTLASAAENQAQLTAALSETVAQHASLVSRWCRYELDPAAAIDFPDMTDVRIPETSTLVRAVTAAALFDPAELEADDGVAAYQRAVATLSAALVAAENAAHAR